MTNIGKNCSAIVRPVSASSLNGTRKLPKLKSAFSTAKQVSQASDVVRKMSSEKVLLRKRRHKAGDDGPALPSKRVHQEQELDFAVVSSPKLGHEEMLHSGKIYKLLLNFRSVLVQNLKLLRGMDKHQKLRLLKEVLSNIVLIYQDY